MKILAIDTSTSYGCVGVIDGDELLAESAPLPFKSHVEKLFPAIQHVMQDSKLVMHELQGIAVGLGPGSFTGLRIGIAAALGFSFALKIPIAGISTLRVLAEAGRAHGQIVASVIDAKRNEVFVTAYDFSNNSQQILPEQALTPEACTEQIKKLGLNTVLVGDGVDLLKVQLQKFPVAPSAFLLGKLLLPVLQMGGQKLEQIVPNYIRKSDAELNYINKRLS